MFELHYANEDGQVKSLGAVKILIKGQEGGSERVPLPGIEFLKLSDDYCSLGQEQSYYEEMMALPKTIRENILKSLRDCVFNLNIYHDFKNEKGFQTSLLRNVSSRNVEKSFRNILLGHSDPTPYHFQYQLSEDDTCMLDVKVKPDSSPPTNVHVIIGRNGVGKTRLLSGIADDLTNNKQRSETISLQGIVLFPAEGEDEGRFANLIVIAFSAFDGFSPIKAQHVKGNIRYQYVGLKRYLKNGEVEGHDGALHFKNGADLRSDFQSSIEVCLGGQRQQRWIEAIKILNADPIFSEYELETRAYEKNATEEICRIFDQLSSGHKITLLSITKLVELVEERSLVLIDEPENHLHPPLLASFTRALSDLLIKRNGVALVATHSPVVVQEVPTSCVTIVDRVRSKFSFYRPNLETFAENVGTLTREVFGLEVAESGFYRMITDYIKDKNFDELMEAFEQQIGTEGRAIARSKLVSKE